MDKMMKYRKFCYWIDQNSLKKVREDIEGKGIQITGEARLPCRLLRRTIHIGFSSPPAWEGFCKRRTSWYRESDKEGQFLAVSNIPLDHLDIGNPIVITESNFRPDRLPPLDEVLKLIESKKYQQRKPDLWEEVDPLEKDFYQKWFERHRPDEPFDFDKTFNCHSANHANFLDPQFFKEINGEKVPYSISDSLHVCSSCLEFYNILGDQYPVKYVVPCIGAVQFARLPMDRYLKVETYSGDRSQASLRMRSISS